MTAQTVNPAKMVKMANPRGFCAGVDRAIDIVDRALEIYGAPVYVRHEVVHNRYVVDNLRQRGAIFVDELDEVPADQLVIFSAHGVSKAVQDEAARRSLRSAARNADRARSTLHCHASTSVSKCFAYFDSFAARRSRPIGVVQNSILSVERSTSIRFGRSLYFVTLHQTSAISRSLRFVR